MATFRVTGIDRESGLETRLFIEARCENHAATEAILRGVTVRDIEPLHPSFIDRIAHLPPALLVASCVAAWALVLAILIAVGTMNGSARTTLDEENRRGRYEQLQGQLNDPAEVERRRTASERQEKIDRQRLVDEQRAAQEAKASNDRSMQNLFDFGYIKRVEGPTYGTVVAQVTPKFMALDFDEKRTTIAFIYVYYFGERDMSKRVELIHSQSGVRVGVMSLWEGIKFFQ